MLGKFKQVFKIKELRDKIIFVFLMLLVFRLVSHIPIPGIDVANLQRFFDSNELLGLLNLFSGGGMQNFSIAMLGITPYITASIILQLLTMISPKLEELSKDGESGRQKITQYTRWLTLPLAAIQAFGMITLLRQSGLGILDTVTSAQIAYILLTTTTGTIFLMWIGELITERKIGNGISILIFASIISAFPGTIQRIVSTYDATQLFNIIVFVAIALVTIIGIIFITEGQRNIPVSYARQMKGGNLYGGNQSHLPLRVNQAGVIPIIFAISIVLFPPIIAQLFLSAESVWIVQAAQFVIDLFQNQLFYGVFYFGLVVAFTYFYTAIIFHPDQISENLQKQGGFIPGVRPGSATSEYLGKTMNRIVLVGALFLGVLAILPLIMQQALGTSTLAIGGTSLLIIVSVVLEIVNQINAQLQMRDYDEL